ncbi:TadE/TadG family type IV pilus assembly protein [Novosphingobium bradum]|uniref:TadE/TadG family type IV pilus assembly protein n=1 Tax=Novosphingobium bradum TaxID=1737444 RepID=A0ABV7IN67_9SPHN
MIARLRRTARRLVADRAAISAVEFAMVAPLLMTVGLGTIELANMALVYTRVSQVAIQVADNASRAKQATGTNGAMMREYDVNDAFAQVDLVYPGLQIYTNGRVILSSLEQNSGGGQWIHWQRCRGLSTIGSSKYGTQGTGSSGTSFAGMGPTGTVVTADPASAIMFVEVYYRYKPIFFTIGSTTSPTIYRAAAMYVRDDRDLSQLYNPSPAATSNTC